MMLRLSEIIDILSNLILKKFKEKCHIPLNQLSVIVFQVIITYNNRSIVFLIYHQILMKTGFLAQ